MKCRCVAKKFFPEYNCLQRKGDAHLDFEQNFFDTKNIFADLNPQQAKAVACLEGPLLVMAGAGSGKTRVLTYRIANLIANGVAPWNILAITFTNKAANEMKSRAAKLIGPSAEKVWLGTFHSFCARILRREIAVTGKFNSNFAIFDAADTKSLMRLCMNELGFHEDHVNTFQNKISDAKNSLLDPAQFKENVHHSPENFYFNIAMVYELYQKKLQENNALDFDDLIFVAVKLFRNYPEVLEKYQRRFRYILVDEYQDTNEAQYILTKLLAGDEKNICVVGDADQSIYGWRGADMRNILNFEHDYPQATVIKLEQNYRSTKNILDAANAVIAHNVERKEKNLWTQNERGSQVKFVQCTNDRIEAATVAAEIRRLVTEEHFHYNDIALLYRTNSQSRVFEDRFMQQEIPYVLIGGLRFYERKEIKDIVAYLHVIANPRDNIHLMRIVNVPRRGLGQTNFNRLSAFADENDLSILDVVNDKEFLLQVPGLNAGFRQKIHDFAAMIMMFAELSKTSSLEKLINTVLNETGYLKMLEEMPNENGLKDSSRTDNLGEFINAAKEFGKNNPEGTLEDFLNHIALISSTDQDEADQSVVRLMTVHAAKGLEFPVVFITGMEEKIFPHELAMYSFEELEEERRAFYVAMTRAQKKLYLTAAAQRMIFGKEHDQKISRFIKEIPEKFISSFIMTEPRKQKSVTPNKPTTIQSPAQIKSYATKTSTPIPTPVMKQPSAPTIRWRVGDKVNHKKWGLGTVMATDVRTITVSFSNPEVGVKILGLKVAPIVKA